MTSPDLQTNTRSKNRQWELKERPFSSTVPLVGPIIVGIRNAWNSVAAKWYIRPIVEQQNDFNRLFAELIDHFNSQLVEEDKDIAEMNHQLAELSTMLAKMNRTLSELDARLAAFESEQKVDESG
jgi:uncharacterized coiled-coil protein SlyX